MGEVIFPNLKFEENDIDFGCILNDTEISRYVTVTNTSRLTVNYNWYFNIKQKPSFLPGKMTFQGKDGHCQKLPFSEFLTEIIVT